MSNASGLFDRGNALAAAGETEAAIAAFRDCVAASPDSAAALFNLGNALVAARRCVEAVDAFVACLRIRPAFGPAYLNLSSALRTLVRLDQAHAMAEHAVRLMPDEPEAALGLAGILHDKADYAAAVQSYRQVLLRVPRHAGALSSLGNALRALGHVTESLAAHDRAVAAAPGKAEYRFNRSTALLAAGDYAQGRDEYGSRWRYPPGRVRDLGPAWRGEDVAGRTVLLHAEQGLGDTIQFVRYVPLAAARGARVILEVQPELIRLLRPLPGVACLIARGDPLPAYEVHCPLLSLPRAFGTRLETVPAALPYLPVDPAAVAEWAARLPRDGRPRIGLVWAGSPHMNDAPAHLIDLRRSIDPADLAPLADVEGVRFVSLQKDRQPPAAPVTIDLMPQVRDFADTAALVANLDLVIAADTSVAHLAGALGRPVWLLSRLDGCWRWLHGRPDSPWYPGMRIYRQQRALDWAGVIRRVRNDLATRRW